VHQLGCAALSLNGTDAFLIMGASDLRYSSSIATYSYGGANVVYALCWLLFTSEAKIGFHCVFGAAERRYVVVRSNPFVGLDCPPSFYVANIVLLHATSQIRV
jgi:hypothetical protein